MLIVTCDPSQSVESTEFTHALNDIGALQVSGNTWVLVAEYSAAALMEILEPLLPDKERDALFIAGLDAFAELQWVNTVCSDIELGSLIRMVRERGEGD